MFEADDFDFSGWFCPVCGHRAHDAIPTFVRCGTCGGLLCASRVWSLPDGSIMFACHDGCGGTGSVNGVIESYTASQAMEIDQPMDVEKRLPHLHNRLPKPSDPL